MIYVWVWLAVVLQRLGELVIARRNESWMKRKGAIVVKEPLYKWIVLTHIFFLVFVILEGFMRHRLSASIPLIPLVIFILLQILRVWCLQSLGRFWNTKIIVLPGACLKTSGPYRFFKHPNYVIVGLEFIVLPLIFYAYITSIIFPVLHLILMYYRIPKEEQALQTYKNA